jgi:hypothetical protein
VPEKRRESLLAAARTPKHGSTTNRAIHKGSTSPFSGEISPTTIERNGGFLSMETCKGLGGNPRSVSDYPLSFRVMSIT